MRLSPLGRQRPPDVPGVTAVARVDRRTKSLTKRIRPGEIAVIDHVDIDRVSAEALVACRVGAVVNASPSISGRYPNLGPEILVAAGIPLVDEVGDDVMTQVREGEVLRLEDGVLYREDEPICSGKVQSASSVATAMAEARAGLSAQLRSFVGNTMDYLEREHDLLLDHVGVPEIKTPLEGRHCLIVVRGYHHREDLATLRPYIREYRPVIIGVDGGADAVLEAGYVPHVIVGDMDSVSDKALRSGAELVVHAYPDGHAPGLARLDALGLPSVIFPATGTSEDIAMLLADDRGASLIVAVGTHATLLEFLDKGRAGMASTFLTRLRVGGKLVDAKGVSRLYRSRISTAQLMLLVLATLVTIAVVLVASPAGRAILATAQARLDDLMYWIQGLF